MPASSGNVLDGDAWMQWTARSGASSASVEQQQEEEAEEHNGDEADPLDSGRSAHGERGSSEHADDGGYDDEEKESELLTTRSDNAYDGEDIASIELSVDSLPSELATGRTGVDELLESMFTEQTVDTPRADGGVEYAVAICEGYGNGGGEDEEHCWRGRLQQPEEGVEHGDQHDDPETPVVNAKENRLLGVEEQQTQAHVPEPATMNRQTQSSTMACEEPHLTSNRSPTPQQRCFAYACQPSHTTLSDPGNPTSRIIAFDVGGKLFRCKESLIRKYPLKRLNQVISCGCEKIGHDTFFIDRNPQHFEVILDWYRTGTYVRHPHVCKDALQEDAKYFDLYQELFPEKILPAPQVNRTDCAVLSQASQPPPRIPPRPHRQQQPPQVSLEPAQTTENPTEGRSKSRQPEDLTQFSSSKASVQERHHHSHPSEKLNKTHDETLRFCKTEHRIIETGGIPVVYMVRKHEHLLVASVKGHGKLLVRVCDVTGMRAVHVESAVLFDSQSYFYLQGGRAKLQYCLLPGGHTYTFWMEIDPTSANTTITSSSQSNNANAVKHELDIEFKLLSSFEASEQLTDALDEELCALSSNGVDAAEVFPVPKPSPTTSVKERTPSFSPYMFLPSRYQQQYRAESGNQHQYQPSDSDPKPRETNEPAGLQTRSERDAVAKQLFSQSTTAVSEQKDTTSSSPTEVTKAPSALSPSGKATKKSGNSINSSIHAKYQSSAIKRNGAAIVAGGSKVTASNNNNSSDNVHAKQAGTITIYQHEQLKIAQSPRGSVASSPRTTSSKSKKPNVATKYQDHQPRLFR